MTTPEGVKGQAAKPGLTAAEWAPTQHPPGSAGKRRVLRARRAAGLPLFHPDDSLGPAAPKKVRAAPAGRGRRRKNGGSLPGVYYRPTQGMWVARWRKRSLGQFATEAEAAEALRRVQHCEGVEVVAPAPGGKRRRVTV